MKREVNNETLFTSPRSYYQIEYIAYYFQLKTEKKTLTHINVYISKVGMPPSHPLFVSFYPRE